MKKRLPEILTREEANKLLKAIPRRYVTGRRNYALLLCLYRLGLRISEALALQVKDVDFEKGTARVWRGKGAKDRTLYLDNYVAEVLRAWLHDPQRPKSKYVFSTITKESRSAKGGTTKPGKPLCAEYVQVWLPKLAKKAGLEKRVHPHQLRHTFASELLQEGYNIRQVQELLGHSDVSTTMIYTHVYDAELAEKVRSRPAPGNLAAGQPEASGPVSMGQVESTQAQELAAHLLSLPGEVRDALVQLLQDSKKVKDECGNWNPSRRKK